MTAQVAERFRHQHVFLVGDSAHRFPPTGGLGLNTGVGDVHNLVWKLAACLRDPQQQPLLETYEQERRPIAQRSTDVSVNNNRKMEEVLFALGLDPSKAQLLQKIMSSALIRAMPKSVQKRIRAILVAPVRKRLALAAEDGPQGQAIRESTAKAIDDQEEHFNTIGLQLGSVYEPNVAISASVRRVRQTEVSTYTPEAVIGSRLPHVALTLATDVTSTLDLLDYSSYTMLVNGVAEFDHSKLQTFGQAIKVLRLDDDLLSADRKTIEAAYELAAGEWLLVRPDGIIADRSAATV
jgi:2,4-dichlorophenol 6-monooxygenase